MKKYTLILITVFLFLAACTQEQQSRNVPLHQSLRNPLFLERYSDEMVDRLVELKIREDPSLKDTRISSTVERHRTHWLSEARKAGALQREGTTGQFIPMQEFAKGEVLYLKDMLYFAPTFETVPGPQQHIYMTTVVDPRTVDFPDEESMDLGPIASPYGAQVYAVPHVDDPLLYRTVVLWDKKLKRLYGFAQLSK